MSRYLTSESDREGVERVGEGPDLGRAWSAGGRLDLCLLLGLGGVGASSHRGAVSTAIAQEQGRGPGQDAAE